MAVEERREDARKLLIKLTIATLGAVRKRLASPGRQWRSGGKRSDLAENDYVSRDVVRAPGLGLQHEVGRFAYPCEARGERHLPQRGRAYRPIMPIVTVACMDS